MPAVWEEISNCVSFLYTWVWIKVSRIGRYSRLSIVVSTSGLLWPLVTNLIVIHERLHVCDNFDLNSVWPVTVSYSWGIPCKYKLTTENTKMSVPQQIQLRSKIPQMGIEITQTIVHHPPFLPQSGIYLCRGDLLA